MSLASERKTRRRILTVKTMRRARVHLMMIRLMQRQIASAAMKPSVEPAQFVDVCTDEALIRDIKDINSEAGKYELINHI